MIVKLKMKTVFFKKYLALDKAFFKNFSRTSAKCGRSADVGEGAGGG